MDAELSKVLISAATGLISGVIGSLIAPWVNWGIEKKKLIRKSREELIQSAREVLAKDDLTNKEFRHLPIYSRIRPYLSKKAIEAVEGKLIEKASFNTEIVEIVIGDGRNSGVNPFKNKVLDELVLLEKKWRLI